MVACANVGVLGLLFVFMCLLRRSNAIWLSLLASGTKCVSEEIQSNVVILADYVVRSDDHVQATPTISAKGASPDPVVVLRANSNIP
ncbi:transmembrane emp24 domain-containing protein p24delta3-like [Salvia hispanica]|uniref:transmembrane emp24 domain-containing protein p24delta3-like n=1 Tax=Salvia hispanica TaxID=49212 RepID=UPI0020093FAD|nr:transmembrane emp24 domain-containing protein p24delta3-like [Salvia hispanica]